MDKYRTIDLSAWHKTGGGANSDSYLSGDGEQMLKLFKRSATEEKALKDYTMAQKVASLGIHTAKVYEIVRVGDKFGVIYQSIRKKKSYSRMVADDPEGMREYAKAFAARAKELHATPCDTSLFTGREEIIRTSIDRAKFISAYKPGLYRLADEMAGHTTCLHGDLQTGNLLRAAGEDYWIDFDRFSYGDPILDIAHMYNAYVTMSWLKYIQNLMHMDKKTLNRFWDMFAEEYFGSAGAETEQLYRRLAIYNAMDLLQKNYTCPGLFADLVTLLLVRPKLKKYFMKE